MPRRRKPRIADAILDQLLAGADPKTAFDPNGLLDDLKKALAERALNAEMDHPLAAEGGTGNGRNGDGRKTVVTNTGKRDRQIPRDRQASFDLPFSGTAWVRRLQRSESRGCGSEGHLPIERIASATGRPCAVSTSTCRSFATISSGLCYFLNIDPSSFGSREPYLREDRFSESVPKVVRVGPIGGRGA
jgi:hypothetical protein